MPLLEYGINEDDELIRIDQVGRGRVSLKCPYCGTPLIAKKGLVKQSHFAHDGKTCQESGENRADLPSYDRFGIHLMGSDAVAIDRFFASGWRQRGRKRLVNKGWIEHKSGVGFQLTNKAKAIQTELPLAEFEHFQARMLEERHRELEKALQYAEKTFIGLQVRLTDLRLYRAKWQRVLQHNLYFLQVEHETGRFYKIGVTARPLAQRITEIEQNLAPHVGAVKITQQNLWSYQGSLELYFKYRYRANQHLLASLTEYFSFPNVDPVRDELNGITDRSLTPLERDVLLGGSTVFEQRAEAARIESLRRQRIKAGVAEAKANRRDIGGSPESVLPRDPAIENLEQFLAKPKNRHLRIALQEAKMTVHAAAQHVGTSTAIAQEVQAALEELKRLTS